MRKLQNRDTGRRIILDFLEKCDSIEELNSRMSGLCILADKWDCPDIECLCTEFVNDYLMGTLYGSGNTLTRLTAFGQTNPIVAAYIWQTNFSDPNSRATLGVKLNVATKHLAAFKKANTVGELVAAVQIKHTNRQDKSVYDKLPPHLKSRITKAEADLEAARRGTPVGWTGRYICSEDIHAATNRLNDIWKEADRWIGRNMRDTARQRL